MATVLATVGLKTARCPERTEDLSVEARAWAYGEGSSDVPPCIQYVRSLEDETHDHNDREAVASTMVQDRGVETDPTGRARAKQRQTAGAVLLREAVLGLAAETRSCHQLRAGL